MAAEASSLVSLCRQCGSGWLWQCSASAEKQRSKTGDDVQGGRPKETPGGNDDTMATEVSLDTSKFCQVYFRCWKDVGRI